MNYSLFGYALSSAIILIICGIIYSLFFESKVKPGINRIVLIGIFFLGIILPLLASFLDNTSKYQPQTLSIGTPVVAQVIVAKPDVSPLSKFIPALIPILNMVYLAGIGIMLLSTSIPIVRLFILKRKSEKTRIHGIKVYLHDNENLSSFSWINQIFIYRDEVDNDMGALLTHEMAHIRRRHWVDLILAQFILILQWFNPMAWRLRTKLQGTHEFQADASVLETGYNEKTYQELLLRNVTKLSTSVLTTGFKSCSLKKRFLMMKKHTFKSNWFFRSISIAVAVVCSVILLQLPAVADVMEQKPLLSKDNIVTIVTDHPEKLMFNIDNEDVTYEDMKNYDASNIGCVEVFQGKFKVIGIVSNELNEKENIDGSKYWGRWSKSLPVSEIVKDKSQSLDKAPEYQGGMKDLMIHVNQTIQLTSYERRHRELEGEVVVAFTVTSKGNIENINIVKHLDSEYDVMAAQLVKTLPGKWNPGIKDGKPCDVVMELPINFTLNKDY